MVIYIAHRYLAGYTTQGWMHMAVTRAGTVPMCTCLQNTGAAPPVPELTQVLSSEMKTT